MKQFKFLKHLHKENVFLCFFQFQISLKNNAEERKIMYLRLVICYFTRDMHISLAFGSFDTRTSLVEIKRITSLKQYIIGHVKQFVDALQADSDDDRLCIRENWIKLRRKETADFFNDSNRYIYLYNKAATSTTMLPT